MPRLLLALPLLALAACTHTRPVDPADSLARGHLNRVAERTRATVRLTTGEEARASALYLTADSASWADPASGIRRAIPLRDLAVVRIRRRGWAGARDGAGVGAGVGLAFSLLAFVAPQEDEGAAFLRAVWPALAVSSAAGGAVYGAVIGAVVGSQDEYELARAP